MAYTQNGFFAVALPQKKAALYLIFVISLASTIVVAMKFTPYHGIFTRHGFFHRDIAEVQVELES
jgi:hypothetical protein